MKKIFNLIALTVFLIACGGKETEADYMWEPKSLNFTAAGSTEPLKIYSDFPLYIVSYPSWVKISPRSGSGTFTANVTAEKNETGAERNGEIRVSDTEGSSEYILFKIPVTQEK